MSDDNAIKFSCPHCAQSLEAESDMAGEVIDCPSCQKSISIPAAPRPKPKLSVQQRPPTPPKPNPTACRYCGTEHSPGATFCVQCGRDLKTGRQLHTRTTPPPSRSASRQRPLISSGAVLLVALLAGGGFFLWQQTKKEPSTPTNLNVEQPAKRDPSEGKTGAPPPPPRVQNASLSGGFWITKGSGVSDVIRGQDVYLLKKNVPTYSVRSLLKELEQALNKKKIDAEKESRSGGSFAHIYANYVKLYDLAASQAALYQNLDTVPIGQLRFMIRTDNVSTYSTEFELMNISLEKRWPRLAAENMATTTQTGIDGKYAFTQVPPGEYTIFAAWESGFNYVEWCLDVDLSPGQAYTLDIHNGNATEMWSKKD